MNKDNDFSTFGSRVKYLRTSKKMTQEQLTSMINKTLKHLLKRLRKFSVKIYFTDNWKSYAELIPSDILIQTKKETHSIERNNFLQRHYFARFRRKTCVTSQSTEMLDLTMSLFAKFCVNSNFNYNTLF